MNRLLRLLGSLRMAVVLLVAIAGVLAWGTLYEARFGTAAVQRVVYRSWWFQGLLAFLALNLAVAALQRYPWKRSHTPFLLAHLGIILILTGGIIGGRLGIEGQLIIPEGKTEKTLQLPKHVLAVHQPNPGVTHVFPTNFEATAWQHEPRTRFTIPHDGHAITLVVDRYYPDAVTDERITGEGDADNPAVELVASHGDDTASLWLLARDPDRFGVRWGEAHILFLDPNTPQQLAALLGQPPRAPGPRRGVVTIELPDLQVTKTLPVPDDFSKPVALDGTLYSATFKDYFTDFAITPHGVVNRSDEPNNPAVALTLTGPEGTEVFLAFALHPDFEAMHNQPRKIRAHVGFTHDAARAALPPNAIALVRHPSGELSCVMSSEAGETRVEPCHAGGRYRHPWLEYDLELRTVYPRAKVTTEFRNRGQEVKAEALHVVAQEGQTVAEGWVGLHGELQLRLNGAKPIHIEYRPDARDLPFSVKLLDFRKIEYPGTSMAAGFESDVELSDAARGLILMRKISMNHPLKYRGYTLFQSSYVPAAPGEPETTILSVRNDPGTPLVYAGFLIVIGGIVSLFVLRARTTPAPRPKARRRAARRR